MEEINDVPLEAKLRYFVQAELEGLQFFHIIERGYTGVEIDQRAIFSPLASGFRQFLIGHHP
jgi:hypothetical protein